MKVREIICESAPYTAVVKNIPAPGIHSFYNTREETEQWLNRFGITNYTIHDDLTVDVKGNVDIGFTKITGILGTDKFTHIPVQFGDVTGSFSCGNNPDLFTLKGSPKKVGRKFNCSHNRILTSLEGGPEEVGTLYNARACALKNLIGAPKTVGGNFNVFDNRLTTLEGAPEHVGGDFAVYYNRLTSLKYSPKTVNGEYNVKNNKLTSLEGITPVIGTNVDVSHNKLDSLHNVHKTIKRINGEFYFSGNPLTKCILGAFMINGCTKVVYWSGHDTPDVQKKLTEIISKYKSAGRDGMLDLQGDLIEAGLGDYAEL